MIYCGSVLNGVDDLPECGKSICCCECEKKNSCVYTCAFITESGIECDDAQELEAQEAFLAETKKARQALANYAKAKKEIEAQEQKQRDLLLSAMERYGVKSSSMDNVQFAYTAASTQSRFDTTKFKKDYPDIAAKYMKETPVKASIKVTVK